MSAQPQPIKEGGAGESTHRPSPVAPPKQDRWEWRRKIRADPRKYRLYRIAVGLAGLIVVLFGVLTGPFPGPGGIPLVLLGLAIWSSEFRWARRLMDWFKQQLHRFGELSRGQQIAIALLVIAVVVAAVYSYLVLMGLPGWFPTSMGNLFHRLPGL